MLACSHLMMHRLYLNAKCSQCSCHLAAQAGVRKSWGSDFRIYTDNNVDASQRLLEACVGRPLHRFVYASSSSLYGDNVSFPMREDALPQPVSPYGVTKLAAEQRVQVAIREQGLQAVIIRPGQIFGPGAERVTPNGVIALAGRWVAIGSGAQTIRLRQ